jgi:predicted nucleotidyltransferase component of viral defense system
MIGKKRVLSAPEQQLLRAVLQTATLAALMDARRWEPGDLAFQGGTSLHLAYGSARFSEDLDFLVRGGLSLAGLAKQVQQKLRLPPDIAADLSVSVSPGKDARNPHMFYVTLGGAQVVGSAKVKVELWQTQADSLKSLALKVSTVKSSVGQAFVPTLTLDEIFADKVYALGARARIKPRDVFDLWWLQDKALPALTGQALQTRLAIYPVASGQTLDTANAWLTSASLRLQELRSPQAAALLASDLKRWLPTYWLMNDEIAAGMLMVAINRLKNGMALMQNLQSELAAADAGIGVKI